MKGDEPAMKYQNVLIFIAGLSLFIWDIMIKVSHIKEMGVCVPRPSTLGPYPRPFGPHLVSPLPAN